MEYVINPNGIFNLPDLTDWCDDLLTIDNVSDFLLTQCISLNGKRRVDGFHTVSLAQLKFLLSFDGNVVSFQKRGYLCNFIDCIC